MLLFLNCIAPSFLIVLDSCSNRAHIELKSMFDLCSIYNHLLLFSAIQSLCSTASLFSCYFYVLIISLSLLNGCRFSFSRLFIKCRIKVLQAFFLFSIKSLFSRHVKQRRIIVCVCVYSWVNSRVSVIK